MGRVLARNSGAALRYFEKSSNIEEIGDLRDTMLKLCSTHYRGMCLGTQNVPETLIFGYPTTLLP